MSTPIDDWLDYAAMLPDWISEIPEIREAFFVGSRSRDAGATALADRVEALTAELAEQQEQMDSVRSLAALATEGCVCSYLDGPQQECPTHGDIAWFAAGLAIARAERDEIMRLCEDGRGPAYTTDPVADVRGLVRAWKVHEQRATALQAKLDALHVWAADLKWQWTPGGVPAKFDQGVGAAAQDVLAILDGKEEG